jgi:signal transduction histidine kinase
MARGVRTSTMIPPGPNAQSLAAPPQLAIGRRRLTEETREPATMPEEKAATIRARAERQVLANILVRETSQRLGAIEDLDAFVGSVLLTMHEVIGGHSATFWLGDLNDPFRYRLHHVVESGRIVPASQSSHPRRDIGTTSTPRAREDPQLNGPTARPMQQDLAADDGVHHDDEVAYLRGLGVRSLVTVPLVVPDRLLGVYTIRLTDNQRLEDEEFALLEALAGQAALTLNLARLAEAAREAALSEERALAARQRTEAAERTAETLRASLDLLAAEPELERFLGHVLRAANTQLNVPRSKLWLYAPNVGSSRLHMICDEAGITADPVGPDGQPVVIAMADWRCWRRLTEARAPIAFAGHDPEIAELLNAMRMQGGAVRSLLLVPLVLGAQTLGMVCIHNTRRDSWSDDEMDLARALGHQATIALQLTRLATKAQEGAVLRERNRLAREIHDTLAQGFAAIRLQLELARGDPDVADEALDLANQIAAENLVEARRSMAVLTSERPSLTASLTAMIDGVRRLGRTREVVADIDAAPEPPPEVAHELLRICQEAMLNAVRHAEANTLRVTLAAAPGLGLRIAVADDGKGFDPEAITKGFGVAGLYERASAINAELAIVSAPGEGAEVIVTWRPSG